MQYDVVTAWVEVDRARLEEYKIEVDEEKRTAYCYIASEVGKEFCVHFDIANMRAHGIGTPAMRGRLKIDGSDCQTVSGTAAEGRISSIRVGDSSRRVRPKFAPIQLTEEESPQSLLDEQAVKSLGSVELVLEFGYAQLKRGSRGSSKALPEARPIYEKLKKAGCHQVVAGQAADRRPSQTKLSRHRTREDITFNFRYRPRELLLAQDIIPRGDGASSQNAVAQGPAQSRNVSVKEDEDEEDEESREQALEAQLAALRTRRAKRKREGPGELSTKRAKLEEIDAHLFFQAGEVIDLTSD